MTAPPHPLMGAGTAKKKEFENGVRKKMELKNGVRPASISLLRVNHKSCNHTPHRLKRRFSQISKRRRWRGKGAKAGASSGRGAAERASSWNFGRGAAERASEQRCCRACKASTWRGAAESAITHESVSCDAIHSTSQQADCIDTDTASACAKLFSHRRCMMVHLA